MTGETEFSIERFAENSGLSAPDLESPSAIARSLSYENVRHLGRHEVEERVERLLEGTRRIGIGRDSSQVWVRGRRDGVPANGLDNIRDVLYPPPEQAPLNRASYEGTSVFYASWNTLTVMEELRVKPGDYVQTVRTRVIPGRDQPFLVVGALSHAMTSGGSYANSEQLVAGVQAMCGTMPPPQFYRSWFVDAFLADEFRRKVSEPSEYKTTAAFSHIVYRVWDSSPIMYPSVVLNGGVNAAVPARVFDEHFEVLDTSLLRIKRVVGFGIHEAETVKTSCDIDAAGRINWDSPPSASFTIHPRLRNANHFDDTFVGWRVRR